MIAITRWECLACGAKYDNAHQASDCSCHGIRPVYYCPLCNDYFYIEHEVRDCIRDCVDRRDGVDGPDSFEPSPTAAELESAGQARLLP